MFYAFEGINGSGKTTVLHAVAKRLRAQHGDDKVITLCNPTTGPIGTELRRFLGEQRDVGLPPFFSDNEATLLFAKRLAMLFMADRQVLSVGIARLLIAGKIVLCDRYSLSTLVYQCAMMGDIPMGSHFAEWICTGHVGVEEPNATFVFDLPVEVGRARLGARGERMDDRVMADIEPAVRAMYVDYHLSTLRKGCPTLPGASRTELVNANRPLDAVVDEVMNRIGQPAS